MEEEQDDDHPCPQAVVLSQTCWEYRNLLGQELQQQQQQQQDDVPVTGIPASTPAAATAAAKEQAAISSNTSTSGSARGRSEDGQPAPKRAKTAVVAATPRADSPRRATTETAPLQTLRLAGKGEVPRRSGSWDIFVLVLQASGLQQITSKAGSEIDFGTLLVADQSVSFFRLTLWARAARAGGRLIRPGDLVRFNGVTVSSFRGAVQASTTRSTSFRVVWRGDAFTTPQDAPSTTMLSHQQGYSSPKGRGGRRRFQPAAGPVLSQDDELAVPRGDACALAAWAKREYPSVTSAERHGQHGGTAGASAGRPGSLGSVRKGVETTVRACVLEASEVERLWVWESAGGKRRKDLVSRATALLTDGHHEMTLQLWGDMASDETVRSLREGAIAASSRGGGGGGGARGGAIQKPAVFEFSRLQPSFSFSCEALVLNGKSGAVKRMDGDSAEAISVSASVLASAGAAAGAAAAEPPTAAAAGSAEHDGPATNRRVDAAKSLRAGEEETARFLAEEGGPAAARRFESVAALMSADGFSGAGYLTNVVVRRVDAPSLSAAPGIAPSPGRDGGGGSRPTNSRPPPPSRAGVVVVDPPLTIYLGDSEDEDGGPATGVARSAAAAAAAAGAGAVLRATVDGGARRDLLGGVPEELLSVPTGGRAGADAAAAAADAGRAVAKSLLDGLEVGGVRGERVGVVLACSAAVDANERVIPGGARYRLVSLEPSYIPALPFGRDR